ncbi:MAG: nitroreductase [Chloroflexi bacterium]|nr:nitroreductase [Chloroflexota bacterium]
MDVEQAIRQRVTVRDFKPDPVPKAVIEKILSAARWAPSQRNRQMWRFIVIQERAMLERIAALSGSAGHIAKAPVAIAMVMTEAKGMYQIDAGRAVQQMELMAWSLGLGMCFVGGFDKDAVKQALGIPAAMELVTVMDFGYRTDAEAGKKRLPLSELVSKETYGNKKWE